MYIQYNTKQREIEDLQRQTAGTGISQSMLPLSSANSYTVKINWCITIEKCSLIYDNKRFPGVSRDNNLKENNFNNAVNGR